MSLVIENVNFSRVHVAYISKVNIHCSVCKSLVSVRDDIIVSKVAV